MFLFFSVKAIVEINKNNFTPGNKASKNGYRKLFSFSYKRKIISDKIYNFHDIKLVIRTRRQEN